jgi:hypothetical protein
MAKQSTSELKKAKYNQTKFSKYTFTQEEMDKMGKELASKSKENKALEDEKKAVVSEYKAKIDAVQAEINMLSNHIDSGSMTRKYNCEVFLDFDSGVKIFRDKGTGDLIAREAMSSEDYQLELDLN